MTAFSSTPSATAMLPHKRALLSLPVVLPILVAACGNDVSPLGPEPGGEVEAFVILLNEHRVSKGCDPLTWNEGVADVAEAHSQDMVNRDFFDHTNPDGDSPADRLRSAGLDYRRMAENIAWGYPTAAAVLEGWLASSGHRTNIENCQLEEHGVGLTGTHWTHMFATF